MSTEPPSRPPESRGGCMWAIMLALVVLSWGWVTFRDKMIRGAAHSDIPDVLNAQEAAWNEGRLEDFMAGYWNSDELTFFSGGTVTKGWQPTLDRYRTRYQGEGKEMGTLDFDEIDVKVLSSDTAFVRGRWKLTTSKDTAEGLFTLQFRRFPDGWKIVHDHTSAADPPKPPAP